MSETDLDPEAVTAAVAASHAAPAPTDPVEQETQSLTSRVSQVEAIVAKHGPAIDMILDTLAAVAPSAAPYANRVEALEKWALGLIEHFQGKVPPLSGA